MTRFGLGLCGLLSLVAAPAWAGEPEGVWTGTIDQAPVVACFESGQSTYYYVRFGLDIALAPGEPGTWNEKGGDGKATGTWRFSSATGKTLAGTWTSPDGRRTLPIKLKRVKGRRAKDCSSGAYNDARMSSVARTPGKEETLAGLTMRPFTAKKETLTGVEIVGDTEELAPLKRAVEKMNHEMIDSSFDCMQLVADTESPGEAQYNGTVSIEAVTEHFVVVRRASDYDCGGAHPDTEQTHVVLDRQTGKLVKMKTWFTTAPDNLGAKLWRGADGDCKGEGPPGLGFEVWPSAKGMVFQPQMPHAMKVCETETTVPYAKLEAKLKPAGKRAVAEFTNDAQ